VGVVVGVLIIGAIVWFYARQTSPKRREGPPPMAPSAPEMRQASPRPTAHVAAPETSRPVVPTRRQSSKAPTRWVPLDETVVVNGVTLKGGIYVGQNYDAVSEWRGVEPALIDPRLPVDLRRPDFAGERMSYWPSYSEIHGASRGAYLRWLESGRPGGAYIGYVFLFFYGIERRVISDISAKGIGDSELPALLSEVERLLGLYSDNGSFNGYARDFLSTARLAAAPLSPAELVAPRDRSGWDLPLEVKLVAGAASAAGEPLAGDWAFAWALHHPEVYLRTPATRCPEEFADLFQLRYRERYGDGLVIRPNKTPLKLEYRPASSSFGGPIRLSTDALPDVTRLAGPNKKLAELVNSTTDELDAYSRWVGRHDDRESARAVALLPAELAVSRAPAELHAMLDQVRADTSHVVASTELAGLLGTHHTAKLAKRDATAVTALLAAHSVGVEPDIRVGPANFSHYEHAVLWRDPDAAAATVGDGYAAATVLLHLGVTVGASDGEVSVVEQEHLEGALERAFDLPEAGRRRLRAHLTWLVVEQPGIAGVKARVGGLGAEQRTLIARYLLAVAGADGHVSPQEVNSLRKLYGLLGLDPEAVHRDLHGMAASDPVAVLAADPDPGDFALPGEVLLDRARLAEVMSSTEQVANVLTAVFVPDEPELESEPDHTQEDEVDRQASTSLAGLDGPHAALVQRLAAEPSWSRPDFEALAAELELMAGGAIETINDAAFAVSDGPLLEGDDPIELDSHVLKEMLHA
jgi:tellurite resistance protein